MAKDREKRRLMQQQKLDNENNTRVEEEKN
jgi:hypothetical protein